MDLVRIPIFRSQVLKLSRCGDVSIFTIFISRTSDRIYGPIAPNVFYHFRVCIGRKRIPSERRSKIDMNGLNHPIRGPFWVPIFCSKMFKIFITKNTTKVMPALLLSNLFIIFSYLIFLTFILLKNLIRGST